MKTSDVTFIVGAGRSGTTWLQLMLGAHPAIATGQESQLFNNYLAKLNTQWHREKSYPETNKLRKHGITSYLEDDEFIRLMREFSLGVFSPVLDAKPTASMFLEKSPNNSFNIDLIFSCFPDARYIHLIRDCRDVAVSVLAARESWGRYWAPKHAFEAASEWNVAVSESLRLREMTDNYLEVRYEELLENGCEVMSKVFEFVELPLDDERVATIVDQFSFENVRKGQYERGVFLNPGVASASGTVERPEPDGFFRKGVAGDWVNSLSQKQLEEVYWASGDLLFELNYTDTNRTPKTKPRSIRQRDAVASLLGSLRQLAKRVFD